MSLFPWREMLRPLRMLEHQLRLTDELLSASWPRVGVYARPWRHLGPMPASDVSAGQDRFQVKLDVQHFAPSEITVKALAGDNAILVEAKHEERADEEGGGAVARHFVRRYFLPEGHDLQQVTSTLSEDGVLTIVTPKKEAAAAQERLVPIQATGPERNQDHNKNDDTNNNSSNEAK